VGVPASPGGARVGGVRWPAGESVLQQLEAQLAASKAKLAELESQTKAAQDATAEKDAMIRWGGGLGACFPSGFVPSALLWVDGHRRSAIPSPHSPPGWDSSSSGGGGGGGGGMPQRAARGRLAGLWSRRWSG
jgi:hypothetical protein